MTSPLKGRRRLVYRHWTPEEDAMLAELYRTYTITVTERQAAELQEACELLARIKIGQIDHAIERLPGFYDRRDWEQVHATQHEIQRLANTLMPEATKRREDGVAWDLYQVIRHRLSWDRAHDQGVIKPGEPRKWPEMMGVCYDEPLKMGEEPLAKIREKTDDPTL